MVKNSSVNNKIPLSRKDDSHYRYISQILPVYLNIYFPHIDMFLDFHVSPANRFNRHSFALVCVIVSFLFWMQVHSSLLPFDGKLIT